ncbi:DIS3-like [Actinidia chinensis var. chinensis]|uniref:DIS3-like n=1 Tax=Actinidia chinensis var. chinensis TaxID=1590841 RepID=A0A2R6PDV7_ACTCC|nr:DIS3-like [Actinidia chinensis var. chinensis]
MSSSGGFAVSRTLDGDRFYNPPAIRRHRQMLQQQKLLNQQIPRPVKSEAAAAENRTDSDDSASTLSKPPSVSSASPPRPPTTATNLDRLVESVTPFVAALCPSEGNARGWRTRELQPYYCLGDLWESFTEWSVYGAGVPLLLNGEDSIKQYYVPYLSGIQLYVEQLKSSLRFKRRPGEESDAEPSRETSSGGSSDCEADRRAKGVGNGSWSQKNLMNLNSQGMNRLSLREQPIVSSSSDETETCTSPGTLLFEYLEQEPPHNRKPLTDKISVLVAQYPGLGTYRSCDLLPSSWISVAWYPIYRIPLGPTLKDLDASFLTFHSLSTHSRSIGQSRFHGASSRKVHGGVNASSKISLPVFGLASYKLKGSILTPSGPDESQQENSLLQAADNWLRHLQVVLPDYQFFRSHYSQWR